MRKIIYITVVAMFLAPFFTFANTSTIECSVDGYTLVTINGIFTDEKGAKDNATALQNYFGPTHNNQPLYVKYLLNPTHIGGLGDLAMAAYQKYFEKETVSDYDLVEMLRTASDKITTRKLLLVAHSQGNFYANSFYDTIVETVRPDRSVGAGILRESIGVYAVATPASRVAGGGKWITSDTDKVISGAVGSLPNRKIMPPNTSIKLSSGDERLGHSFSDVYLKYRGAEIVSDIQASLDKLKVPGLPAVATTEAGPCIDPPALTIGHRVQGTALAVIDPVASFGSKIAVGVVGGTYMIGSAVTRNIAALLNSFGARLATVPKQTLLAVANPNLEAPASSAGRELPSVINPIAIEDMPVESPSVEAPIVAESVIPEIEQPSLEAEFPKAEELEPVEVFTESPVVEVETEPEVDAIDVELTATDTYESVPWAFISEPIPDSHPLPSSESSPISPLLAPAPAVSINTPSVDILDTEIATSTATSTDSTTSGTSEQATSTPPFDATPPVATLSVLECQSSISPNSCLTLSTSLHISWISEDADLDYYILNLNGTQSTTTATSTIATAANDSSFMVSVQAVDLAGNESTAVSQRVYVSKTPVVINELAWGGTSAHFEDEWIELYNRSSQDVNLSGFTLYSKTDGSPYINLVGNIPSRGYFLIEAKNTGETDEATQSSVGDITADLWTSFGMRLVDAGENILLTNASTTIDEVPYCYRWCGVTTSRTTERFNPDGVGNIASNWSANNAVIYNGKNISGGTILGTPRARNSLNYLIGYGPNVSSSLTLTKANSPYLVNDATQTIVQGATWTVEPGVVIKFRGSGKLAVDGNLVANGTALNPIVFTSFADDSYGGDMDRVVVAPVKGSWFGVELSNKSLGSSFAHTIFRYGGNYGQGTYKKTMLYADHVSPPITDSTFEFSKAYGAYLNYSDSDISNNIFRDNSGDSYSNGLYVSFGAPKIDNNTFERNKVGLSVSAPDATITNNKFTANTTAMYLVGPFVGEITGNSGDANSMINISSGVISSPGATTTLVANPMPYFLGGTVTVPANSALDIMEGTVIKNSINGSASLLSVYGRLNIDTPRPDGVIFSSIISTSTKQGWMGIVMNAGSNSHIKGATIQNSTTGIKYTGSPIWLENVIFSTNGTAVQASGVSPIFRALDVNFTNNTTNKNPSGLW